MDSVVQALAEKINMTFDEFIGEMRKRGCSEPTAIKIWRGEYENFENFNDNDVLFSNLCKADSVVQALAEKINMTFDEFVGEMRKRGCSEPTAIKIWRGEYENFENFNDNDMSLSNLRKAADVLKVKTGKLLPK
jgi:hypothetical protein